MPFFLSMFHSFIVTYLSLFRLAVQFTRLASLLGQTNTKSRRLCNTKSLILAFSITRWLLLFLHLCLLSHTDSFQHAAQEKVDCCTTSKEAEEVAGRR